MKINIIQYVLALIKNKIYEIRGVKVKELEKPKNRIGFVLR
jgi:hypothetical protein